MKLEAPSASQGIDINCRKKRGYLRAGGCSLDDLWKKDRKGSGREEKERKHLDERSTRVQLPKICQNGERRGEGLI